MSYDLPCSVTMAGADPTPGNELKIKLSVSLLSLADLSPAGAHSCPPSAPKPPISREPIYLDLERTNRGFKPVSKVSLHAPKKRSLSPSEGTLHPESEEKTYTCRIPGCGKTFSDSGSLRKHTMTHGERQFVCTVQGCNKKFLDNSKLRRHMLVHTVTVTQGEKPFRCEFCHKHFSLDFNLRTHLRTHTGEKPYQCTFPGCMKRFTQSSNLTAHEKTHSMHEGTPVPRISRSYQLDRQPITGQAFALEQMQENYSFMQAQPAIPEAKEESALPF